MTTGRSLLAADEKLMPTRKMRADQQVAVIKAACMSTVPLGAVQLAETTGFPAKNCGLVPMFAVDTGLLVKAHRSTMYLPSRKGRAVARAFARSEEAGLEALRSVWRGQWFGRAMRERLGHGPVTREGLVAKLLLTARANENRIRQAHVLLDLLVVVGMVVPCENGLLYWYDGAAYALEERSAPQALDVASAEASPEASGPQDTPVGDAPGDDTPLPSTSPQSEPEHASTGGAGLGMTEEHGSDGRRAAKVPDPRRASTTGPHPGPAVADDDLLALLLPPVLLADLTRLTEQEVIALHGHLRAVASLTAKLRGRPVS
ncbi:hypothetical protein [Streptomyces sp. NPDC096132]|uniref:hypothetical protein n=1 Tax=Streptomyces sp. NPDC096132 TaxID=3366075 RepID=UPI0038279CCE